MKAFCYVLISMTFYTSALAAANGPKTVVFSLEDVIQKFEKTNRYTQGLLVHRGVLYESTGFKGKSGVYQLGRPNETGYLEESELFTIDKEYFGEGIAVHDDVFSYFTWSKNKVFRFNVDPQSNLAINRRELHYPGKAWGLTTMGNELVLSNGSDELQLLDPVTLEKRGIIKVTLNGKPLKMLNELEFFDGKIYANVYYKDLIYGIDPNTGKVESVFDFSMIKKSINFDQVENMICLPSGCGDWDTIFNGIAFDPASRTLYITGKNWPAVYSFELRNNE